MAGRIRRVRNDVAKLKANKANTAIMKDLLQSIAKLQEEAACATREAAERETALFGLMTAGAVDRVEVADAVAEVTQSAGKASNIIDVKAFRKKVSDDDFLACISVGVTKAKEVLGQKELDKITTTIPGKTGEKKLKITRK